MSKKKKLSTIVANAVAAALAVSGIGDAVRSASAETVSLRAMDFGSASVQVDSATGIIHNCAVMTIGPTLGHPFAIDSTTLLQARDLINRQADGVKIRFKHPGAVKSPDGTLVMADDAGTVVGNLMPTTQIVGDCLRGDVKIEDYAATLPGLGDARSYLLSIADKDPQNIGLSVVMAWTPDRGEDGSIVARVSSVMACDFVGKPAANPNGLLAAKEPETKSPAAEAPGKSPNGPAQTQPRKAVRVNPKLKAQLVAMGMDPEADDTSAMAYHDAMGFGQKAKLYAKCAADDKDPPAAAGDAPAKPAPAPAAASAQQPVESVVSLEAKRVNEVTQLGAVLKVDAATISGQIAAGADAAAARPVFLAALTTANAAIKGATGSINVGQDAHQVAMLQAVSEGIALRAGYATIAKPHELSLKLQGLTVIDMGRRYLAALGATDVDLIPRAKMADILLNRRQFHGAMPRVAMLAESVGDFPAILLDAINKTFRPLYLDAPKTWPTWVRRASAADFKNINRAALSEASSLKRRDAGGEINYAALSDGKETYSLSEYVGGIKITRKAVINDDMDCFGRIPQLQANSCWRAEEEAVYGVLTVNALMGVDNTALFASGHANLVSGTANLGAPSVTTATYSEALMLKQKGPLSKGRMGLRPKFIITPMSLMRSTQQFLTSADLISVISTTSAAPQTVGQKNPFAGGLTHVYSAVLDETATYGSTQWFLAADYRGGQIDTIEISFLDGEPEPVLRQETDFDSEDVKFAVRHTLAAKAIDFRGLVSNPGQ